MESENFLLTIAVIAVLVSAFGFTYVVLDKSNSNWLTGFALTSTGTVNLTISTSAAINFTTNNINWGTGNLNNGTTQAVLDTSAGTVTNGSWTTVSQGFRIENYGNVNLSVNLNAGKDAAAFIGGTNPSYQFNVSNNEASSCTSSLTLGSWYDLNTTSTQICSLFSFLDASDLIKVDIKLIVPYNAKTGALGDIVTATATAL